MVSCFNRAVAGIVVHIHARSILQVVEAVWRISDLNDKEAASEPPSPSTPDATRRSASTPPSYRPPWACTASTSPTGAPACGSARTRPGSWTGAERAALGSLLVPDPELHGRSRFAWLRDLPESPAPANLVALLDRLDWVRAQNRARLR
jgi:hypothetical protein